LKKNPLAKAPKNFLLFAVFLNWGYVSVLVSCAWPQKDEITLNSPPSAFFKEE
jgi:hypothetical protein